jgi:predicted DNA-binding transcriptional regulator AlpA
MKPQHQALLPTSSEIPFDPDSLETEREAADFLGVTTRALQKWRATGTGPRFVRISGRCVRYRRRDLIGWAEARLKSSTSE